MQAGVHAAELAVCIGTTDSSVLYPPPTLVGPPNVVAVIKDEKRQQAQPHIHGRPRQPRRAAVALGRGHEHDWVAGRAGG